MGNLVEKLAEYAHISWSNWMKYVFEKSEHNPDGTVTIPKWAVMRWKSQIGTDYNDLPENMKDSDRTEAIHYIINLNSHDTLLDNITTITTYRQHFIYQFKNGIVKFIPCEDINKVNTYDDDIIEKLMFIDAKTIGRFEDKLSENDLVNVVKRYMDGIDYYVIGDVFYHGCEALQYIDYRVDIIFFNNPTMKSMSIQYDRQLNEDELKAIIDAALEVVKTGF